jgi:chromate transporter
MANGQERINTSRLIELAQLFLKLGTIGFGGPQAHIAMQNDEAVVRRKWMTADQFSEGLAVCEMLPGPASTQMGIYIGYLRAGQLGALVAGLCFIAPAFVILVVLSWLYFRFQTVPQVEFLFLGISPVVTAIILGFCWKLGKRAIRDWTGAAIALVTFLALWQLTFNVLLLFIIAGIVGLRFYRPKLPPDATQDRSSKSWLFPMLPSLSSAIATTTVTGEVLALSSFWGLERIQDFAVPLFLFFLRVGSFIFGGGLVIIPLLEYDVVERFQWLTQTEFINGVAIGQLTPGPVVLTAAFVGFKVAGVLGALVSAIAIFLPSFAFIMLASPLLIRIRQNPWIRAFLRGVISAVLGAIAAAAIPLAQTAIVQESMLQSVIAAGIAILALVALIRYKTPTWQLVPAGAVIGLMVGLVLPA